MGNADHVAPDLSSSVMTVKAELPLPAPIRHAVEDRPAGDGETDELAVEDRVGGPELIAGRGTRFW